MTDIVKNDTNKKGTLMKINEGYSIISRIPAKSFKELFTTAQLVDIKKNKGKTGQLLETAILHLGLSNRHLDFEDGELKSNKVKADGSPAETMFICQISKMFDSLMAEELNPYATDIYDKIKHMIYVAVDKSSKDETSWKIHHCKLVSETNIHYKDFYNQCAEDILTIFKQVKNNLKDPNKMLHTTNGKYLQIRTKDSQPYHPIFSNTFSRYISDKNFAIYMTKEGIRALNGVD